MITLTVIIISGVNCITKAANAESRGTKSRSRPGLVAALLGAVTDPLNSRLLTDTRVVGKSRNFFDLLKENLIANVVVDDKISNGIFFTVIVNFKTQLPGN
jgi:hypothetical protein